MRVLRGGYEDYLDYATHRRLHGAAPDDGGFVIIGRSLATRPARQQVADEIRRFRQQLARHDDPRHRAAVDEVAEFRRELKRLGGPA